MQNNNQPQPMGQQFQPNQYRNMPNLQQQQQHNQNRKRDVSYLSMSLIISDIPIRDDKNTQAQINASQLNTKRNTTIDDLYNQLQPIKVVTNLNTNRGETKNWISIME
jgi:sensor histidine kinase regulating citrate/malate metabolism